MHNEIHTHNLHNHKHYFNVVRFFRHLYSRILFLNLIITCIINISCPNPLSLFLGYVQEKERHNFSRAKMHTLHLLENRASKIEFVMNLNVPCKLKNGMLDLLTLDKDICPKSISITCNKHTTMG